jgi:hypothetical protein
LTTDHRACAITAQSLGFRPTRPPELLDRFLIALLALFGGGWSDIALALLRRALRFGSIITWKFACPKNLTQSPTWPSHQQRGTAFEASPTPSAAWRRVGRLGPLCRHPRKPCTIRQLGAFEGPLVG